MKPLPLTALVAMLALAACNNTPQTTDNAAVNVGDAADFNDAAFNDTAVEDVSDDDTAAVTVAALPKLAPGTPAVEAAPLTAATEIEEEIRSGNGVQRIRHGDGWAWTRGGKIVRTADRDGGNVAYFRGGEANPFFVQRGERAYAFQGGKPVREFDRDGKGRAPDADRTREASEVAQHARDQRDRAERARDTTGGRDRGNDRGGGDRMTPGRDRPGAAATATPAPTPSPTARPGRDPNNRPGSDSDRPRRDRDN